MNGRIITNVEKEFVLEAIKKKKRVDNRELYEFRSLSFLFGEEHGHVEVHLGNTKVLVQVSCDVAVPFENKPNEGVLSFNFHLSQTLDFKKKGEIYDQSEYNNIIETCFRDSKVIETESLCIVSVDIHVLDHCGNFLDCACIAVAAALRHFKRPDVSFSGEHVIIHKLQDRPPVALSFNHYPLCVSFGFFDSGTVFCIDPTDLEERIMDGRLVIAMNVHKELYAIQHNGGVPLLPEQIIKCSKLASIRIKEFVSIIENALKEVENELKLKKHRNLNSTQLNISSIEKSINEQNSILPTKPIEENDSEEDETFFLRTEY